MNKGYKKKKYYILMSNVYKCFTIALLVSILFLGIMYINVKGEKKCVKTTKVVNKIVNENVVFFGDSITDYYDLDKYFPDLKKVNSGINGNKTWDLKNDMYNRLYRYNPSKVVLLIGINNFLSSGDSIENVVNDIKAITKEAHENLPNTEIIVQSIYPINTDWSTKYRKEETYVYETTNKIIESNKQLKDYCKEEGFTYIDMFSKLSDENNEFSREYTEDGLHPNENGYNKITEVLKKYL